MDTTPELVIKQLAGGGRGLSNWPDGRVIFVANALPGERVKVRVTRMQRDYLEGTAIAISNPAPERVEPACVYFGRCGGCDLMHLDYQAQVKAKRQWVMQSLRRVAQLPEPEVIASPLPWGYRNRLRLHGREQSIGLFAQRSNELVAVESCLVANQTINELLSDLAPELGKALPHTIEFLADQGQGFLALAWRPKLPKAARNLMLSAPALKGVRLGSGDAFEQWHCSAQTGLSCYDKDGIKMWAFPGMFCQVNFKLNQLLVDKLREIAGSVQDKQVLDLYAGSGNLSLPLAAAGAQVLAVESSEDACQAGCFMAEANNLAGSISWQAASVRQALRSLKRSGRFFDLVVLDPPREGAKGIMEDLAELGPEAIVYVSCHAAALARDVDPLLRAGYEPAHLAVLDMFPQTSQVETMITLKKT